jgi:hypothetical protein
MVQSVWEPVTGGPDAVPGKKEGNAMMRAVTPHERSGFDGATMSGPVIGILEALGQAQADQLGVKVDRAIEVTDRDCNMAYTCDSHRDIGVRCHARGHLVIVDPRSCKSISNININCGSDVCD